MKFREWLSKQKDRQDAVGALAQAAAGVTELPLSKGRQHDEHKRWAEFLTRHGSWQHILAFNEAWEEFLTAREALQNNG